MERWRIGLGRSDFKDLKESPAYYVDKSLLIHDILKRQTQIYLFPRPRRFGKTLNLSMLRYFFENTQESNRHLFEGLAVSEYPETMAHQGKYPVIFLTFKDAKQNSWEGAKTIIASLISELYRSHHKALKTVEWSSEEKEFFQKVLSQTASSEQLSQSIKFLMNLLHRATGQKVILLIDEYDIPIDAAYQYGYYDDMILFSRNLLSGAFKDNKDLQKGILTGILRVAKESIFSGLNNLEVYNVLDHDFSEHFGFTQPELNQMFEDFERKDQSEDVQQWYNGYRFGNTTIYNPWSILSYFSRSRKDPQPYWVNTGGMELIRRLIQESSSQFQADLHRLMEGTPVTTEVHDNISLRDLNTSDVNIWSLLLMSGYLTPKGHYREGKQQLYQLIIPNLEVECFYDNVIQLWLSDELGRDPLGSLKRSLITGEPRQFQEALEALVLNYLSYHDVTLDAPEKVYHAFVLGLLVQLQHSYWIESNHESGYGRYDVSITPKDLKKPGLILEFKKIITQDKETAKTAMKSALQQIQVQQYAAEMKKKGIREIYGFGVVVDKKKVWIEKINLSD